MTTIAHEINAAKVVRTVKVMAYKNGEGRLRHGEMICGSSIEGVSLTVNCWNIFYIIFIFYNLLYLFSSLSFCC